MVDISVIESSVLSSAGTRTLTFSKYEKQVILQLLFSWCPNSIQLPRCTVKGPAVAQVVRLCPPPLPLVPAGASSVGSLSEQLFSPEV